MKGFFGLGIVGMAVAAALNIALLGGAVWLVVWLLRGLKVIPQG